MSDSENDLLSALEAHGRAFLASFDLPSTSAGTSGATKVNQRDRKRKRAQADEGDEEEEEWEEWHGIGGSGGADLPFAVGAIASSKGVQVLQPIILALLGVLLVMWVSLPNFSKKTE